MHKDTERQLAALENLVGKDPVFGLTLAKVDSCINKDVPNDSVKALGDELITRVVKSMGLRKTPSIIDSIASGVYIGNYKDTLRR